MREKCLKESRTSCHVYSSIIWQATYITAKYNQHFYIMLGLVPSLLLIFFVNLFIGPAELTDIPEDYEPRHWEYHKVGYFIHLLIFSTLLRASLRSTCANILRSCMNLLQRNWMRFDILRSQCKSLTIIVCTTNGVNEYSYNPWCYF